MPLVLQLVCYILAAVLWLLGTVGVNNARRPLNLVAAGLFVVSLVWVWNTAVAL